MKKIAIVLTLVFLFSCEAIFVEDISNERVQILAPQDATSVTAGTVNFSWNLLDDADSYSIQIATPNFSSASQIVLDSVVDVNSINVELELGEYEWRIKAINTEYETQYTTVSFQVN